MEPGREIMLIHLQTQEALLTSQNVTRINGNFRAGFENDFGKGISNIDFPRYC